LSLDTFTEVGGGKGSWGGETRRKAGEKEVYGRQEKRERKAVLPTCWEAGKSKIFLGGWGSCSTYISANLMQEMTKRLSSVSDVMQTSW